MTVAYVAMVTWTESHD